MKITELGCVLQKHSFPAMAEAAKGPKREEDDLSRREKDFLEQFGSLNDRLIDRRCHLSIRDQQDLQEGMFNRLLVRLSKHFRYYFTSWSDVYHGEIYLLFLSYFKPLSGTNESLPGLCTHSPKRIVENNSLCRSHQYCEKEYGHTISKCNWCNP